MTKKDWDWHAPKSIKRFFDFYLEDASTPENGSEQEMVEQEMWQWSRCFKM